MTAVAPFPLQWPEGRPRRPPHARKAGRFHASAQREGYGGSYRTTKDLSVADALGRLEQQLGRIGARWPVVSTNIETRLDGRPRSGVEPVDPGVAVYFELAGKPTCLPCDTYQRVAHNIMAVAAHIEATRAIERHGVATVAEMFSGFAQLEARTWWKVLELNRDAGCDHIEASFRRLAKTRHPDAPGGSHQAMAELNRARAEALKERTGA